MVRKGEAVAIVLCSLIIVGLLDHWGFIPYLPSQKLVSHLDPIVRMIPGHSGEISQSKTQLQQNLPLTRTSESTNPDNQIHKQTSLPDCNMNPDGSIQLLYTNDGNWSCRLPNEMTESSDEQAQQSMDRLPDCLRSPSGGIEVIYSRDGKVFCNYLLSPTEEGRQAEEDTIPKAEESLSAELKNYLGTELLQVTIELANKKEITYEELVSYALTLINKDRRENQLPSVILYQNDYSQFHAEDMVRHGYVGHWTSDGLKPYMGYTLYGGEGAVSQNTSYQYCTPRCNFNPIISILKSHYTMMYDDLECCNDGHRKTILDRWHNQVSIGIAYNDKYFALAQDFQNFYINWIEPITIQDGFVNLNGINEFGKVNNIAVYYDSTPRALDAEELRNTPRSYDAGEFLGAVLPPLPDGYQYNSMNLLQVASEWHSEDDGHLDIAFNLYEFYKANESGVYTIYANSQQDEEWVQLTSYSFFLR